MSLIYLLSVLTRSAVFILVLWVAVDLWRVRRVNGPLVNRFAIFFVFNATAMAWYIVASLLSTTTAARWVLPYMWEWAWIAWTPLLIALLRLWRALHPRRSP